MIEMHPHRATIWPAAPVTVPAIASPSVDKYQALTIDIDLQSPTAPGGTPAMSAAATTAPRGFGLMSMALLVSLLYLLWACWWLLCWQQGNDLPDPDDDAAPSHAFMPAALGLGCTAWLIAQLSRSARRRSRLAAALIRPMPTSHHDQQRMEPVESTVVTDAIALSPAVLGDVCLMAIGIVLLCLCIAPGAVLL